MYLSIGNMDEAFKAIKAIKENRTTQQKLFLTLQLNFLYQNIQSSTLLSKFIVLNVKLNGLVTDR